MRDVPAVLLTAGRLLLRHWPALVVLACAGSAVRYWALQLAVVVSDWSGPVGIALLVAAPLAYLIPVVAMLSLCRRSLPALQEADQHDEIAATEGRRLRLVDVAVSVLVPFLAVYESYDLLSADIATFRNRAAFDEFITGVSTSFRGGDADFDYGSRLGVYPLQVAIMVVVIAWVLRWSLGRIERRLRFVALAFVGALVEVYYTTQVGLQYVRIEPNARRWLQDRVAVEWLTDLHDGIVDLLGPVAGAFRAVVGFVGEVTSSLDAVVVVPVAWLALGAVVLGFRLPDGPAAPPRDPPSSRGARLLRSFSADLRERFGALASGLRLILAAGLAPMLVFCLCFLVVLRLPGLLHEVVRTVVGPQEWDTWLAILVAQDAASFALSLVLVAPLLAAGVDWLVRTQTARRAEEAATTPALA